MAQCKDPTDLYANIQYWRGGPITYFTNPFPIAAMASTLASLKGSFQVIYVETSGPNGESAYAGDGYAAYLKAAGTSAPAPIVGSISADGQISCNGPIPCPTGSHWDLDLNKCVPDVPARTCLLYTS